MTVSEMLDQLANGDISIEEAADFVRSRKWAQPKAATPAEYWGVADPPVADDNSWSTIDTDPRLSSDEYAILAKAYSETF
jgi:hypothetical protein